MNVADLAHDVTYIETMAKALANTSANLVNDVADLKSRLEKLPVIVTDVRIGPGEYHSCPVDPAPVKKLGEIVEAGGLVLVEDSRRTLSRLLACDPAKDIAIVTPLRSEMGRQTIQQASKLIYGYIIYLKLNA